MKYKVQRIIRDVRVAIDENQTSVHLIATEDIETLSLDELIRSKIEPSVRFVESTASPGLLEEGHNFGESVFWGERGSGWVFLPDDFMRLIAFRMSDWERTVYSAVDTRTAEYAKQSSRYKGIRGNHQKPVCALVNRPEGKALEFYSCKSRDAYVACGMYVPYPRIDEDDCVDISERCYEAVVYTIASQVLAAYGEYDKSRVMNESAQTLLME